MKGVHAHNAHKSSNSEKQQGRNSQGANVQKVASNYSQASSVAPPKNGEPPERKVAGPEQTKIKEDGPLKAAQALLSRRRLKSAEERRKEQVAREGVKQSIYLGYIHKELSSESACLELPLTILVLLSFAMFAISILQQEKVYAVEYAMEFDIIENANFAWAHNFGHKGINDVNSIADFWSWLRLGYLPLVVQPTWMYSEDYPAALGSPAYEGTNYGRPQGADEWLFGSYDKKAPVTNDYLRHNRIVGGIKLHQTVAEASPELCQLPTTIDRTLMEQWLGKSCTPSNEGVLFPELRDIEQFGVSTRTEWLFTELDDMDELHRVLLDMEDGCTMAAAVGDLGSCRCRWCREQSPRQPWIDEQTERVEVTFVTYNPHYGLYTYVGTSFLFNRGGHIHKLINVMSAWADPMARPIGVLIPMLISGSVWALCILYVFINETLEIIKAIRSRPAGVSVRAAIKDYASPWNIVDWVSVALAVLIIVIFFQLRLNVGSANIEFAAMMEASARASAGTINRQEYEDITTQFYGTVENMVLSERSFRLGLFAYPSIIMCRLFKSFHAQPRLAIVTKTLERAAEDLIHFGIVFFCVFFCLAVNSILFFGQDIEGFTTLPRAVNSCFRAMFGDWDFGMMSEIGLLKAQIWFWSFMLIMVLILLNMLLAVIMDAYTEEKARAKAAQSLGDQTYDILRRYRQFKRGERVRLNDIWEVFEKEFHGDVKAMLASERMIKISDLTENVRHLQPKQAKRTLENSLAQWENQKDAEVTDEKKLHGIRDHAKKVEMRIETMMEDMEYLTQRVQYYDRMQASGDPEYDFHFGGEGRSANEASQEAIAHAVTDLSQEICGLFVDNLKRIEGWQDAFERQQNELHGLVAEMQIMVRQQAWCVAAMSEAVEQLGAEEDAHGQEGGGAG